MKTIHILVVALLLSVCVQAQVDRDYEAYRLQAQADYKAYRDKEKADYEAFRKKANEEYAAFVEKAWVEMHAMDGIKPPTKPKPKTPPLHGEEQINRKPIRLDFSGVDTMPTLPPPIEVPEIVLPAEEESDAEEVDFFATKVIVRMARRAVVMKLASLAEREVSKAWRKLSGGQYDALLKSCLTQRRSMSLCDWAYMQLCGRVAEKVFGRGSNEAVLLQAFLLTQSGYRVRLAENGGRLVLLAPFDHTVYNYSYLNIDGLKYYALSKGVKGACRVCQAVFPRERTASIAISKIPRFGTNTTSARTFKGRRYPDVEATVAVNRNLMDFYSQYPVSSAWDVYARTSLSEQVKQTLHPVLRKTLVNKSERQQVDMLLDFVQNAFDYATDQEQFGYERPLFADESFYYPYNDCEDRSILFSILVRELVGLDVVLLHWPDHLATAVHFNNETKGDYLTINGLRYTVCDPTYIGASVGETMPQYITKPARVVKIH